MLARREFLGTLAVPFVKQAAAQTGAQEFDVRRIPGFTGTGPYVRFEFDVKNDPSSSVRTHYVAWIDSSALIPDKDPAGQTIYRITPAFIAQFNPELYMSFAQIRNTMPSYKGLDDTALGAIVADRRRELSTRIRNSALAAATMKHLVEFHGMNPRTIPNALKACVPALKKVYAPPFLNQ